MKNSLYLEVINENGLKIYQDRNFYCFTQDSIQLANFVKCKPTDVVVEFCSGCGVVSFFVNDKFHTQKLISFEIDKNLYELAILSQKLNKTNIQFVNDNVKNILKYVETSSVDTIFCNPPYYKKPQDTSSILKKNLNTKFENKINIEEILVLSSKILKNKGSLYLVFLAERLGEVVFLAQQNKLILKNLQFVLGKNGSFEYALFKFVKNGRMGVKILNSIQK